MLPIPDRHPDDAALAWFGRPAFQLVEQPSLRIAGWESQSHGTTVDLVGASYYLADENGEFDVLDPPASIGRYLRGRVYSEAPGATYDPGDGRERAALAHHLGHIVVNDRINQPDAPRDFGSASWHATTERWRSDIRALEPSPAELDVDGRRMPGIRLGYGGYLATTAAVDGRIVTLVLHTADAPGLDTRLVTRPE